MESTHNCDQGTGMGATQGARRATGVAPIGALLNPPDPEVMEKKRRRVFTAAYKLRILEEADACTKPGEIGALLRREGLYSSNLTTWRRQRDKGLLEALAPRKRGRKATPVNPLARRVAELERENQRLREGIKKAQTIIEVQKKISELMGIPETSGDNS